MDREKANELLHCGASGYGGVEYLLDGHHMFLAAVVIGFE
jgi:hypothetical protein